jgi:hypothetical protein
MPRLFDLLGRMSVQGDCGRVGGEVTSPFFFFPLKRGLVRRARRSGAQSRFFTPERHSALLHVLLQTLYILMWRYSKTYGDVISSGGSLGYARDKFCREKSKLEISRFARNDKMAGLDHQTSCTSYLAQIHRHLYNWVRFCAHAILWEFPMNLRSPTFG